MAAAAYTNNPAWILYDLCTNRRYGLGIELSATAKAELYNISKYNDALIDDGFGGTERRFTFNYQFTSSMKALEALSNVASMCRTMVYYDGTSIRFSQDRPSTPVQLVTSSNVIGGLFNYTTTKLEDRHNVVRVTWFDIDNLCKQTVEVIEDAAGIARYNDIKIKDVVAIGCTSRGQAYRYGKWILDTELNQTDFISYKTSLDHLMVTPGDIIEVFDAHYAGTTAQEGRLVSATTSGVVLDDDLDMQAGHTYYIDIVTSSGTLVLNNEIINTTTNTTNLTFTSSISADEVPQTNSIFVITDVDTLSPRQFKVLSIKEVEKYQFEVMAVEHDPNKFDEVEDGFQFDEPIYTNIPSGGLQPPSNLAVEEYSYMDGGTGELKFGVLLDWTHSPDTRTLYYEIQWADSTTFSGAWNKVQNYVAEDSYLLQPLESGVYDFRIRSVSATIKSVWDNYADFTVIATNSGIGSPTNLRLLNGIGTTYSGLSPMIAWDIPTTTNNYHYDISVSGSLSEYRVEVYRTVDDELLRREHVKSNKNQSNYYTYWYEYNIDDNYKLDGGLADPEVTFKVYAIDIFNNLSDPATLAVVPYEVPDITGLQTSNGSTTTFSGSDINIVWNSLSSIPSFKDYRVVVYDTDDTLLRTEYVTDNNYIYTYGKNQEDHATTSGIAQRSIKFKLRCRNRYNSLSQNDATITVSNPVPNMAGLTPTLTPILKGMKIGWNNIRPLDNDGLYFKVYFDTNATPTTEIAQVGWENTSWYDHNLDTDAIYYARIEPYDGFGVGNISNASDGSTPLKIEAIDIDAELSSSIVISDSEGTISGTLAQLYDKIKTSGGPSYDFTSSSGYINYDVGIEYFIDRMSIWTSGAAKTYVSYERNDGVWHWLKAEADHTLDANDKLVAASDQSDAQTNYWTLSAGINSAIFPQGIVARNLRLYIYDSNVQVYELVFGREVIAEFVVAEQLSAISADLGAIQAGTIQSEDWDASNGTFIDLSEDGYIKLGGNDNPKLYWNGSTNNLSIAAKVTFESSSTGYTNISDKPTSLSGINSAEGSKLTGIEAGATVGANWLSNLSNIPSFGDMALEDLVESSKLGTTIIDGGYIKTSLLDVDNIIATGSIIVIGDGTSSLIDDAGLGTTASWTNVSGTGKPSDYADVSPALPSDANLVAYWSFDDGSGAVAVDNSGRGHDATLVNTPTWVQGIVSGKSIDFEHDSDQYATVANHADINFERTSPFSISTWVNLETTSTLHPIFSKGGGVAKGYTLYISISGFIYFSLVSTTGTNVLSIHSSGALNASTLYHIVATYDGSSDVSGVTLYVNGVEFAKSATYTNTLTASITNTSTAYIGKLSTSYFDGIEDELRIYNKELTADEVKALYLNPSGNKSQTVNMDSITNGSYAKVLSTTIDAGYITLLRTSDTDNQRLEITASGVSLYGNNVKVIDINSSGQGSINLLAGSDITLAGHDSNYAKIVFDGTSYNTSMYSNTAGTSTYIIPSNTGLTSLFIGTVSSRFNDLNLFGEATTVYGYYDAGDSAYVSCVGIDGGTSRISFKTTGGGTSHLIWFTGGVMYPVSNKIIDLGRSGNAFDDMYADDFNNVADIPFLDDRDDLAYIMQMEGSGKYDERTGLEIINDDKLPDFVKAVSKNGKKEILYDPDGKPYFSMKAMFGWHNGAIRQLNKKVIELEKQLKG
ncbi:MAG: LamG-like jellyroll fold domain-containing protein [Methanogenium sp.]|jgi:hypothetical protein